MLSLVDLKDFAEICRALEEYAAAGGSLDGPIGARRRAYLPARPGDDARVADSIPSSHRFYGKGPAG